MRKRSAARASTSSQQASGNDPEDNAETVPPKQFRSGGSNDQSNGVKNDSTIPQHDIKSENGSENGLENNLDIILREWEEPCGSTNFPPGWQSDKSSLSERFSFIFNSEKYADIYFLVGKEEKIIPAHTLVLSVGSARFEEVISRRKKNAMVKIPYIEPDIFLALLKFLYSDTPVITMDNVMDVHHAAKEYAVFALSKLCMEYLRENLDVSNAFKILSKAVNFGEEKLIDACLRIIDVETGSAIQTDEFTNINLDTLCMILERDSLRIKEHDLVKATLRWSEAECARRNMPLNSENRVSVLGNAVYRLRFPLLSLAEFSSSVAEPGLLSDRDLVSMFLYFGNIETPPPAQFSATPRVGPFFVVDRFLNSIHNHYRNHVWNGSTNLMTFSCDQDLYLVGIGLYGSKDSTNETYMVNFSVSEDAGESSIVSKLFESIESPRNSEGGQKKIIRLLLDNVLKLVKDRKYYIHYFQEGPNSFINNSFTPREITVDLPGMQEEKVKITFYEEYGQKIPEILFTNGVYI